MLNREQVGKVLEYLRENPRDYTGAGRVVGLSRSDLFEEMRENPAPYRGVMDEWLDRLESRLMRSGMGELEDFPFNKAIAILRVARAEVWGSSSRSRKEAQEQKTIETSAKKRLTDDGEAGKMIERYLTHQFGQKWIKEEEIISGKEED